jgi:hypothetical protein
MRTAILQKTVYPEPVEGLHFCCGKETKQGFDRLSPNGVFYE